jgi:predicted phosphodiesterase
MTAERTLTVVALSDTHGRHDRMDVPPGDVLIHAGDLTSHGTLRNLAQFDEWLGSLPHPYKIIIAGNHDWCFQRTPEEARALVKNAQYLQDEETIIEGVKFYGSPWQPWFNDWAFNLAEPRALRAKWNLIPRDTQVLLTHGPPHGHCDRNYLMQHTGCRELLEVVAQEVSPAYHVFGHIHEAYGVSRSGSTTFLNVSACDCSYRPVNPPVCFSVTPRAARPPGFQ